ncbi:MAG: NAD(P)-dependent alcohol dehydrogenase, partial [Robiginitalea sp.]
AEFITLPEEAAMAPKPANLSHEEAASIVFGGHTALHFIKKAGLRKDQSILVYGASGSVGSAAVQLARYYHARVTAVCSQANAEMVRALGAEQVIDYTKTDISSLEACYDMVYETVNKVSVPRIANLLSPGGTLILGAAMIKGMLQGFWISNTGKIKVIGGVARAAPEDIQFLADLAQSGHLKPVIDRVYPLEQMAEAHAYVEKGHKKGNVVIRMGSEHQKTSKSNTA